MIIQDNIQYRNLEEQVQKNQDDIKYLEESGLALSEFGISVKDVVPSIANIPNFSDPDSYTGTTGDAYAVGTETPYIIYVYTAERSGQTAYIWLNLGSFPMPGPKGPIGPQGLTGSAGEQRPVILSITEPTQHPLAATPELLIGDLWLKPNGDVYQYDTTKAWILIQSIIGPQGIQGVQGNKGATGETGPQGPKGPKGETGSVVRLISVWPYDVSQLDEHPLPSPSTMESIMDSYLVPQDRTASTVVYLLFVQVGADAEDRYWNNMGPITASGTQIFSGGKYQVTFNIDDKLTKVTEKTSQDQVYAKDSSGSNIMVNYSTLLNGNTLAMRTANGALRCNEVKDNYDAINKDYLSKIDKSIVPLDSNAHTLGSRSKMFRDIYCASMYSTNDFTDVVTLRILDSTKEMIKTKKTIIPSTTAVYSLGSNTNKFKSLYLSGDLSAATLKTDNLSGTVGDILLKSSIVPNEDDSFSLGSEECRFKNGYFDSLSMDDFNVGLASVGQLNIKQGITAESESSLSIGTSQTPFDKIYVNHIITNNGSKELEKNEMLYDGEITIGTTAPTTIPLSDTNDEGIQGFNMLCFEVTGAFQNESINFNIVNGNDLLGSTERNINYITLMGGQIMFTISGSDTVGNVIYIKLNEENWKLKKVFGIR